MVYPFHCAETLRRLRGAAHCVGGIPAGFLDRLMKGWAYVVILISRLCCALRLALKSQSAWSITPLAARARLPVYIEKTAKAPIRIAMAGGFHRTSMDLTVQEKTS